MPTMPLKAGVIAPDFKLPLSVGREIQLYSLLNAGPVVLNFIKGTWCPNCTQHMKHLSGWQEDLEKKRITSLVISNEATRAIKEWLAQNPVPFLFASDVEGAVARMYGVHLPIIDYSRPATFVIDADRKIRLSHCGFMKFQGKDEYRQNVIDMVCELPPATEKLK